MADQRALDELLGLSASAETLHRLGEPLMVMRVSPSFQGERALSLHRNRAGEYVLRSVRLTESASERAAADLRRGPGSGVAVSPEQRQAALRNVRVGKHIAERPLDARTARSLLELWQALLARAQPVREVGAATGKGDGIIYSITLARDGAVMHSPRPGSVLALAVGSAELLFARVDAPSANDDALLRSAESQMQIALRRTRQRESCLMPYVGDAG